MKSRIVQNLRSAVLLLFIVVGIPALFILAAVRLYGLRLGPAIGWLALVLCMGGIFFWRPNAPRNSFAEAISIFSVLASSTALALWSDGTPFFSAVGMGVVGTLAGAAFLGLCWYVMEGRKR